MTSMIDVVFLLLIFFLVTTTFVRPERQLPSAIKVVDKSAVNRKSILEPAIVDVVMSEGLPAFKLGAINSRDIDEIKTVLESFENKSEGAFVRVADQVPFENVALAISACRSAGFSNVSYIPLPN